MPKPQKKQGGGASAASKDSRFANFESDPRFRLPSKSRVKTKIDKRFQRVFEDEDFTATAKLDRYGRKLKSDHKKKALRDIYEPEDAEVDDDDVVQREIDTADANYDPARGGGFSSSESDPESDDEDDDDDEEGGADVAQAGSMQRLRDEQAGADTGEVTKRFAVVNLDWDNIKATDLMALFSSFAPQGGRVEKVSIYPSEFGKERMKREELEGPPKEIFKTSAKNDDESEPDSEDSEEESDDEEDEEIKKDLYKEEDDQDFDSDALRSYQLDRLRYYYGVVICSDPSTAEKIYSACDGTEYLASSNFIDLRFVPDDTTFDDGPRDECDSTNSNYQPTDFVTDALQHSKVKLTWDVNPDEAARRENIRRAFTGSRTQIEENDLRAYLASGSEGENEETEDEAEEQAPLAPENEPKLSRKELKARKLREALGLGAEPTVKSSAKDKPVGDMEITFTAALMGKDNKKEPETEETTAEKYIRKERERKARKKEIAVAKRNGVSFDATDEAPVDEAEEEDLGFDDPFFTTEEPVKVSKASERKEERRKRREEKEALAAETAAQRAHLEGIMAGDEGQQGVNHFNMDEITRAEKKKAKKLKGKKLKSKDEVVDHGGLQEGLEIGVADDNRFKAVFENHEFAIDPSYSAYKNTPVMKQILEEGRKKRKNKRDDDHGDGEDGDGNVNIKKQKKQKLKGADDDLSSLVESIRRKAKSKQ